MPELSAVIDLESRSVENIKTAGLYRYAEHPTTRVLSLGYKIYGLGGPDDGKTKLWAPWYGWEDQLRSGDPVGGGASFACPADLSEVVRRGGALKAHNAQFEIEMWDRQLTQRYGWPAPDLSQWVCTMAQCAYNGVPLKLADVPLVVPLKTHKGDNSAMLKLCKPRPAWSKDGKGDKWFFTRDLYTKLLYYNIGDVDTEDELDRTLVPLPAHERRIWAMDLEINRRGIPVDRDLVRVATACHDVRLEIAERTITRATNGVVTSPNQVPALTEWIAGRIGGVPNLQKATVDEMLSRQIPPDVRAVLLARQSAGGAATAKFAAIGSRVCSDGYLKGELCYYGAHTGRWTSKGVQIQNLAKNAMSVEEAEALIPEFIRTNYAPNLDAFLTTIVRSSFKAPEGWVFIDFDLGQIEARMIAWMAGEESLLQAFRDLDAKTTQYDVYEQMAAEIYQIPLSQITKKHRALGKVAILGLGYGMGVAKFYETAIDWGVSDITMDLAERAVGLYRDKYPKIRQFWYDLEAAMTRAIRYTGDEIFGRYRITYSRAARRMTIYLANGRPLYYHKCQIGDDGIEYFGRLPPPRSGYGTVRTWGGKTAENIDQAQSRDIFAGGMLRTQTIAPIVLTVHDEILWMARAEVADQVYAAIKAEMTKNLIWAEGLPLAAGGWIGPRVKKD